MEMVWGDLEELQDTEAPEILLIGEEVMFISVSDYFSEPGCVASDVDSVVGSQCYC